jgi:ABC-type transport system involved in multi-copper enzyme maturation permease subunit
MLTMFVRFFLMIFGICGMFWLLISLLTEETDTCTKRNKPKDGDKDLITNANNYWFQHFKQQGPKSSTSSSPSRRGHEQNESDDESVASSQNQSTLNSVLLSQTSLAMMCDDEVSASQKNG